MENKTIFEDGMGEWTDKHNKMYDKEEDCRKKKRR